MPGRTVGELVLLEQHDIGLAHRGQVLGVLHPMIRATDDHDLGLGRHCRGRRGFTLALVGS